MSSTPTVPALKKMVEAVLAENTKYRGTNARNSDIALTVLIWLRYYSVGDNEGRIYLYQLFDLPREDNIKRVRAVFQNVEHKYLPTDPAVLIKRGIEEAYWFDALGYNLTADEWRTHHQTVAQTKPRAIETVTDMLVVGQSEMQPMTLPADQPRPVTYTTKMKALYLPKSYSSSSLKTGEEYEIEVEQLATGRPIKLIAPIEAVYPNLQSFGKTWKVIG